MTSENFYEISQCAIDKIKNYEADIYEMKHDGLKYSCALCKETIQDGPLIMQSFLLIKIIPINFLIFIMTAIARLKLVLKERAILGAEEKNPD